MSIAYSLAFPYSKTIGLSIENRYSIRMGLFNVLFRSNKTYVVFGSYLCLLLMFLSLTLYGEEIRTSAVRVHGNELIYVGRISSDGLVALQREWNSSIDKPTMLAIDSGGGSLDAGMDIGQFVFENNLAVLVNRLCVSACANYVFPAGKQKFVTEHAIVAWHGGATNTSDDDLRKSVIEHVDNLLLNPESTIADESRDVLVDSYYQQARDELDALIRKEKDFYNNIGINPRLPSLADGEPYNIQLRNFLITYNTIGGDSEWAWYYSIDDLQRLGVYEVYVLGSKAWRPAQLDWLALFQLRLKEDFE